MFRDFLYVVDLRLFIIAIISVFATRACEVYNYSGSMPTSLIGLAVVFPIVFSINSAFQRRDEALEQYGSINANLASIYFAHVNWPYHSGDSAQDREWEIKDLVLKLIEAIKLDITVESNDYKKEVYQYFNVLSKKNVALRDLDISSGEISRINNWLNNVIISFERLSSISDYRTPKALRAYSKIFLHIFPILFAPYFAYLNVQVQYLGFIVAIGYSAVLVMLSNIQDQVENPFDSEGLDDIDLERENRFKKVI
ncbi:MAG: hypothetical protein ACJZ9A_07275 [Paracoccaceae bacterium]